MPSGARHRGQASSPAMAAISPEQGASPTKRILAAVPGTRVAPMCSEAAFCLDQELDAVDRAGSIEREGDVDVYDVAERGTAAAEPQADPDILEQAEVLDRAQSRCAPGTPHVEEHGRADVRQLPQGISGEEPLLERHQRRRAARLVAHRIAAQAAVAAEGELVIGVEVVPDTRRESGEEDASRTGRAIIAQATGQEAVVRRAAGDARRQRSVAEHRVFQAETPSAAGLGMQQQAA